MFGRCRTFHDRHYDRFPGFIGPVGFVQVSFAIVCHLTLRGCCHRSYFQAYSYWLDGGEDALNYERADQRLARTYLLASQLSVDLALAPQTKVRKRSVSCQTFSKKVTY